MARRQRGEGSVAKRADGLWVGRIDVGVVNGKRKRKVVYGKTQREAIRELTRAKDALRRGDTNTSGTSLAAWLNYWLAEVCPGKGVKPKTLRTTDAMPTGSPRKPRRSWESLHWFAKHGQPWSDAKANGRPMTDAHRKRFPATAERNGWGHGIVGGNTDFGSVSRCQDVVSMSKVNRRQFDHPAPYPTALAEWVARLICPPGGTILDPFNGSGSTGIAAIRNGYSYVGIDAVEEYVQMTRNRLGGAA